MIGLRELAMLGLVVLVLYGRSGVFKSRQFQTIRPWISPVRRPTGRTRPGQAPAGSRRATESQPSQPTPSRARPRPFLLRGNRLFWFLTILAATAVAALIITRLLILNGLGSGLTR